MKQFLLGSALIFSINASYAQITISQSDFPGADDTALVSVSEDFSIDVTQTGANQTWDYSDLHIISQRIDTFYNVADASVLYQLQFNNIVFEPDYASDYFYNLVGFDLAGASDAGITIESPVGFVKISSSSVENVGMGLMMNSVEIPMASDTIDTEYELPMNYLDSWNSNSYIYVDLNPAFNGIFVRHQQRYSEVDGWGTITTRLGTFDVLRVRSELYYDDSAYVDFGFGGTWLELPTPDEVHYTWWSEDNKIPVLKVIAQVVGGNESVTRIEFKDIERNLAGIEESVDFAGEIYPNPATNTVNVLVENGVEKIEIYSIAGELVYSSAVSNSLLTLDVENWNAGVYLVKLISNESVSSSKLIIE